MRLLLDTHALLWWLGGDTALSQVAKRAINDESNDIHVSAASVWEIATKFCLGRLAVGDEVALDAKSVIDGQGFLGLPVSIAHGQAAGALPGPHKDPFDRMLIAQAMLDDMILVSNERPFDLYGVKRLW